MPEPAPPGKPPAWQDPRVRALVFQALAIAAALGVVAFIFTNTMANLRRQGIASGFDFFGTTAGFGVSMSLIEYAEHHTYFRAFLVGLLNTMLVSAIGIVLATFLGFTLGIMRLSRNWLVAKLAAAYVEIVRNLPLLLQIFVWYFGILRQLPGPRQSVSVLDAVFLNNRGLFSPEPVLKPGFTAIPIAVAVALVAVFALARWARQRREQTGQHFHTFYVSLAILVGVPFAAAAATGFPLRWQYPELQGFNFVGGMELIPELVALVLALSTYTAAFIGEIVRAGILGVSRGQLEAAQAVGLTRGQTLRLVIVPQALRIIVPPLTSQYLNLTKNSSLAAAIAYPDLVLIFAGTVLMQTGQAIEVILVTMAVYLTFSLLISLFMNWYNRRIALVER
ncbi:MAG: amino acid ABC transporter permease [Candidatus Rokubacteria bacterium]|nr:amino acid ABC transporter permease [Candidatus Rokubacteria bacterium]